MHGDWLQVGIETKGGYRVKYACHPLDNHVLVSHLSLLTIMACTAYHCRDCVPYPTSRYGLKVGDEVSVSCVLLMAYPYHTVPHGLKQSAVVSGYYKKN